MSQQTNNSVNDAETTNEQAFEPTIVWNSEKMVTTHANVCNVMGTKEEMILLFGTNQMWQAGQQEIQVDLSNRIVLNPHAAKRLYTMLGMGLAQYESRFGEIEI